MANLIITSACNIRCPFCFASESVNCGEAASIMKLSEYQKFVEFGDASKNVRFCGGEPTLHPQFCEMVEMALARKGVRLTVMTNGLWSDKVWEFIRDLHYEDAARMSFLVNTLHPKHYRTEEEARSHRTLTLLGKAPYRATIGITLYAEPFDYSYAVQLAQQFGIQKLRYSVAAPNIGDPRTWHITPRDDFPKIANVVHGLVMEAKRAGIRVTADCGYVPPCAFSKEQLADMLLAEHNFRFSCHAAVDIGVGGDAWRCYGLYSVMQNNVASFSNEEQLRADFTRRTKLLDDILLFEDCEECVHKENGLCGGGCYSLRVRDLLQRAPKTCLIPIDSDEDLLRCTPILDDAVKFDTRDPQRRPAIYLHANGLSRIDQDENTEAFINACDGTATVADLVNRWRDGYESRDACQQEVLQMVRDLFRKDAIRLKPNRPRADTTGPPLDQRPLGT